MRGRRHFPSPLNFCGENAHVSILNPRRGCFTTGWMARRLSHRSFRDDSANERAQQRNEGGTRFTSRAKVPSDQSNDTAEADMRDSGEKLGRRIAPFKDYGSTKIYFYGQNPHERKICILI